MARDEDRRRGGLWHVETARLSLANVCREQGGSARHDGGHAPHQQNYRILEKSRTNFEEKNLIKNIYIKNKIMWISCLLFNNKVFLINTSLDPINYLVLRRRSDLVVAVVSVVDSYVQFSQNILSE